MGRPTIETIFRGKGKKRQVVVLVKKNALSFPRKAIFRFWGKFRKILVFSAKFRTKTPLDFRQKFRTLLDFGAHFRAKNAIAHRPLLFKKWPKQRTPRQ